MMFRCIILLIVVVVSSCNNAEITSSHDVTVKNDTIAHVTTNTEVTDTASTLVFKANGSEPGWHAEFYSNKLKLVVDYGKDSLELPYNFSTLIKDKDYSFTIEQPTKLIIDVKKLPCINEAGDKTSTSVSINYKSKTYTGCGEFID